MFSDEVGSQVAWLLPAALILLLVGLWVAIDSLFNIMQLVIPAILIRASELISARVRRKGRAAAMASLDHEEAKP